MTDNIEFSLIQIICITADADEKEFHPNTDVTDGVDNDLKDHPTATKSTDDQLQSRVYPPSGIVLKKTQ